MNHLLRLPLLVVGLLVVTLLVPATALAAPALTVSPTTGTPTTAVRLVATGFGASEAVDVFADTTAVRVAVADANGKVVVATTVPASARPGSFWFTLIGRRTGNAAQVAYTVRTDSPQPGFDGTHASYNRYENVITTDTARSVQPAWSVPVRLDGTPVVAVNRVFGADAATRHAQAYSASSSARSWDVAAPGTTAYLGAPVVTGGLAVFLRSDDGLAALNVATGATTWTALPPGGGHVGGVVAGGAVVVAGYDNGIVRGLTAATGVVRWNIQIAGVTGPPAISTVAGRVVVPTTQGMYGLDLATGATAWVSDDAAPVNPPAVSANVVVYTTSSSVCTLDLSTGETDFCVATSATSTRAPAVADNTIYTAASSRLVALDLTTGATRWTSTRTVLTSSPFVAGGLVWCTGTTAKYTAFDQRTGAVVASVGSFGSYSPVVANGVLYTPSLTTSADRLVAFTLPSAPTDGARPDVAVLAAR